MFDWNHNGKKDAGDSFMNFMIFNQVMNGGKKKQPSKAEPPQRDWVDELEKLDTMVDEDN